MQYTVNKPLAASSMPKAKSRLKKTSRKKHRRAQNSWLKKLLIAYLTHLPTLLLGLLFGAITYYIITQVYPEQIKNWLLPASYLPLLIVFFLTNLFVFSFLLLKTRHGLWISSLLTILLFLKLQLVVITWPLVIGLATGLMGLELICWLVTTITH
ncbi:MAG: hypothetical protein GF390_03715 [Candidatus Pacebacteria bacterium]|nr:hypothetical protein [Candidatus Paceibacterota bacterium]